MASSPFRQCESGKLDGLPTEILVEIMGLVDAAQIAACRLVCRRFNHIATQNARLRYPVCLAIANCVDGHPEHPSRVGARLKLLLERQKAWRTQDFRAKRRIYSSEFTDQPSASAYRNGTLVLGALNVHLIPSGVPAHIVDLLSSIYMNELHVLYLLDTEVTGDLCHQVYRFDKGFSDFELEHSQDLLVLWNSFSPPSSGLNIRFLSLSDGKGHKRAKSDHMEVPTETFFPGEHHPDAFYAFDVNTVQLNGELACVCAMTGKRVLLLNWVTGNCWTIPGSSCCVLSKECVIVASCHSNPPYFDVFRIIYADQPPTIDHVRRYMLPRVQEGTLHNIDCRPSPPFNASTLPVTPECPAVPFSTAPGSAMVVFSYRLRLPHVPRESPDAQFALLCYTARFLSEVQEYVPRAADQRFESVAWESWGPDSSFFLGEVKNHDNVWSYALYGYRLMLENTIYDFNPRNVSSAIDREEEEEGEEGKGMRLRQGTSSGDNHKWFTQKIETNRAFLSAAIKKSIVPASTSCFLVDEDVLALEDTTDTTDGSSRQVIVTQLAVGPE